MRLIELWNKVCNIATRTVFKFSLLNPQLHENLIEPNYKLSPLKWDGGL